MKRFTVSILFAVVFFMGLGSLLQKSQATMKSDERALTLIRQAREAIGGEANINNVRSLSIKGNLTKNFEMEGVANTETGEVEINMQLPNQLSKSVSIKRQGGSGEGQQILEKNVDVVVVRKGEPIEVQSDLKQTGGETEGKVFIVKKDGAGENVVVTPNTVVEGKKIVVSKTGDGNATFVTEDGKKIIVNKDIRVAQGEGMPRQNELFRTTLGLLLTAPEGVDVSYTYGGDASVDGNSCDVVIAQTGGASYKLFLDKSTHLPRMLSYQGVKPLVFKFKKAEGASVEEVKDVKVMTTAAVTADTAEFQVKFSDYRSVNGVQLPYRWEQTVAGKADETVDVVSYEVNPANIADKFVKEGHQIFIRTKKPE
ncbi:MAG TPA: hypothetical protein PKY59_20450 [Pyrinomonadaceae bacterium]|nr:hypothetical protein [Pyrinomonadaceae bacterium]